MEILIGKKLRISMWIFAFYSTMNYKLYNYMEILEKNYCE